MPNSATPSKVCFRGKAEIRPEPNSANSFENDPLPTLGGKLALVRNAISRELLHEQISEIGPVATRSTANFQGFMRQQSTRLVKGAFRVCGCPRLSYYTYPPSVRSELFYTDLEKLSAQPDEFRTHLSLHKDAPLGRAVQRYGNVAATPVLSGLHHRHAWI